MKSVAKFGVATAALTVVLSFASPATASADLFDDIFGTGSGGGGGHSDIRLQPAPEEPWVWPTDPWPIPDPARKRDQRKYNTPPQPKKPQSGECNADTPFGCL